MTDNAVGLHSPRVAIKIHRQPPKKEKDFSRPSHSLQPKKKEEMVLVPDEGTRTELRHRRVDEDEDLPCVISPWDFFLYE